MKIRSIRWRLPLRFAGITFSAVLALGIVLLSALRIHFQDLERQALHAAARRAGLAITQTLANDLPAAYAQEQAEAWAALLQVRVQYFDAEGELLADSGPPTARRAELERDFTQPTADARPSGETDSAALPGSRAYSWELTLSPAGKAPTGPLLVVKDRPGARSGATVVAESLTLPLGWDLSGLSPFGLLVASRLDANNGLDLPRSQQIVTHLLTDTAGQPLGTVLLSGAPAYGDLLIVDVAWVFAIAGLFAVVLAWLLGAVASRRITAPLLELASAVEAVAGGDAAARVELPAPSDLGGLPESFNAVAAQLESAGESQRRFVADAARELHTPLTGVRTALEMAEANRDPDSLNAFILAAKGQTARLETALNSLLDLARVEAGLVALVDLDLNDLVTEVGRVYAASALQAGLELNISQPEEPVLISGDRRQLRRALGNLLDNAIKFTPAGEAVNMRLEQEEGWALLTVEDTGFGIPEEDLPRLFSRFHRGRNAAAQPGCGLGLALVKAIAEAHNGQIGGENTATGARFRLRIPLESP